MTDEEMVDILPDEEEEEDSGIFPAMPFTHMEFIAKQSIDLYDIYTLDQDSTNYLWGFVDSSYTMLQKPLEKVIKKYHLPEVGNKWWIMRYVIIYKFVPIAGKVSQDFIPLKVDDVVATAINMHSTWGFYAIKPNLSYSTTADLKRVKNPIHPQPLPNEYIRNMWVASSVQTPTHVADWRTSK